MGLFSMPVNNQGLAEQEPTSKQTSGFFSSNQCSAYMYSCDMQAAQRQQILQLTMIAKLLTITV